MPEMEESKKRPVLVEALPMFAVFAVPYLWSNAEAFGLTDRFVTIAGISSFLTLSE